MAFIQKSYNKILKLPEKCTKQRAHCSNQTRQFSLVFDNNYVRNCRIEISAFVASSLECIWKLFSNLQWHFTSN